MLKVRNVVRQEIAWRESDDNNRSNDNHSHGGDHGPALAIYAAGSLFYALLVHKIGGWLVARPARMGVQDHP